MNFEQLNLRPELVRSLHEQGIDQPTDIQAQAIPLIKSGNDLIGISKTGSGKTVAFGAPLLEKVIPGKGLQALIMSPTRELAQQISEVLNKCAKYTRQRIAVVYGGVGMMPQIEAMGRCDIVVGTPGRLLDHLRRGNLDLSKASTVILDEADKMVEMGFIEDVELIIGQTPKSKQVLLFGATISEEINKIRQDHMNDPKVVRVSSQVEEEYLEQYYYNVLPHEKFSMLVHLLRKEPVDKAIIFCSARRTVDLVAMNLKRHGIHAEMTHGKLNQNKRQQVMESFNNGKARILIASAVAARGLDVKDVTHVFNYDLSQDPQEYIHRIGRTARAGETGKAITLLSDKDYEAFSSILRSYSVDVKLLPKEDFQMLPFDAGGRDRDGPRRFGGFRGRRDERSESRPRRFGDRPRSFGDRPRSFGGPRPRSNFRPAGRVGGDSSGGSRESNHDDNFKAGNWRDTVQIS